MSQHVTYMLRRVLCPWRAEEVVEDTLRHAGEARLDEIMWITESSGMYKELPTLDEVDRIVERLGPARERTVAAGLLYSINPLTTLGHGDYGRDGAEVHPEIEWMVGMAGGTARFCACPLSPAWRELIAETFARYAATQPTRLWIEDDFRYANHMPNVRFGCFCERHLAAFAERVGERVEREAVVAALLQPGEPHPWRAAWLDFMDGTLADTGRMIREAVHAVSPETEMGWMSTTPSVMEVEGRRPRRLLEALAGDGRAAIRMPTTCYIETGPRDLYIEDLGLKKMLPQLPERTTRCTETETFPHSIYSCSAARIGAQIAWACVLDVPNQTLNIYDYLGASMERTAGYTEMLRERKPLCEALAETFGGARPRGVGLLGDPESARFTHAEAAAHMSSLYVRETGWATPLRAVGAPVCFSHDESVTAITGQALRARSTDEIEAVFARGVLLDLSALQTLQDMGLSDLAGVRVGDVVPRRGRPVGPEELTDPDFAGGRDRYTWTYGFPEIGVLAPAASARQISRIVDPGGEPLWPGVVLFENRLGGRAATFPYRAAGRDPDPYADGLYQSFYSELRRDQLRAVLRWLGRGSTPLLADATGWTLPHRADAEGRIAVAVMNLNLDAWSRVGLAAAVDGEVRRVERLGPNGEWRELDAAEWHVREGELTVELSGPVRTLELVAVRVEAG